METKPSNTQVDRDSLTAVRNIIKAIDNDPYREGVKETPRRVVNSWKELYKGYNQNPTEILSKRFDAEAYDQMVIQKDIEMFSTCEHHLLPFYGHVKIGYVPDKNVVGISKLARLVECFSRRLQIQERMTQQIGEAIVKALKPKGAIVVCEAKHFCMISRGVNKNDSTMITSFINGVFTDHAVRSEFFRLIV